MAREVEAMGQTYTNKQAEYIDSVGGGAHASAIRIIGSLEKERNRLLRKEFEADLYRTVHAQVIAGHRVEYFFRNKTYYCTIWAPLTMGHRGYSGESLTMSGALEAALQALEADSAP
jgi:hypothetical protein